MNNFPFLLLGPKVSLSSLVLDFGCVEEGGEGEQTVELVNSSPAEAIYQWDLDCSGHSVFSIHPASGTVRPHSHTTLKAVYRPAQPIAHHRRVALLILHRVGANMHKGTHSARTQRRIFETIHSIHLPKLPCRTPCSLT